MRPCRALTCKRCQAVGTASKGSMRTASSCSCCSCVLLLMALLLSES